MLATSPSPRVTPASSPTLNDFRRRSHSNSQAGPIVKPRGQIVYSYPNTSTNTSTSTGTSPTPQTSSSAHPTNLNSHQCHLPDQRFSFQPQASQAAPRSYSTASRGTQTSPSHLELQEPKQESRKVQMVDAQTQCSPTLSSRPPLTPATEIANLQIETSSASSTASSSSSTTSIPRSKLFDPVADAAMSHGPTAALTSTSSSRTSPSVARRRSSQTQLRRTHSSATKRNHSVSNEPAQSATTLQNDSSTSTAPAAQRSSNPSSAKKMRPDEAPVRRLPQDYSQCPSRDLVHLISSMLLDLIRFNDGIPLRDGHLTRFHSRAPPGISVLDYLQRLTTHATLPPPILLSMVYYIDKLCALYPAFTISSLTVHRFLITAATVASKGLSDSFWTNKTYARVGGVSVRELALLEMELLTRVQWRIVPQPEVLVDYYKSLVARTEGYEMEGQSSDNDNSNSGSNSAAGPGPQDQANTGTPLAPPTEMSDDPGTAAREAG